MRWSVVGVGLGIVLTFNMAFLSRHIIFGAGPINLLYLVLGTLLVLGAAFVSALVPALRATRVDPMTALRCE